MQYFFFICAVLFGETTSCKIDCCLVSWPYCMGEVHSILTDFSFLFGKGPDSSWDSCKVGDFFFKGWGTHFLQRNYKFWEDPDLFKSCWFLYQSPNHLWNVSMLVSITVAVSVRFTTLTGHIVWPTFNSIFFFSICPKKHFRPRHCDV